MKIIKDLKEWYPVVFESAIILAILLVLLAFKIPTNHQEPLSFPEKDFEIIKSIDIPITNPNKPPNPPKPSTIVEVPNHEIIDEPIGDLEIIWEDGNDLPFPKESKKDDKETIFKAVEQPPEIKGGIEELYKKINYPRQALLAGIEGIVKIQFVVDRSGTVKNATVIRGIGGGCDEEALKAVNGLKFEPGRQRGIAVPVQFTLPVVFKINN